MKKFCNLYFVRHGETDWNARKLMHGTTDIPLNEKGETQAQQVKNLLSSIHFDAAFCSDLVRAKRTAELILEDYSIPLILSEALRERFIGSFEGSSTQELDEWTRKFCKAELNTPKEQYLSRRLHPEVESPAETYQRIFNFLNNHIPYYLEKNVLVVTHGGVIRSILDHCNFAAGCKWVVSNCGIVHLQINSDEMILKHHQGVTKVVMA